MLHNVRMWTAHHQRGLRRSAIAVVLLLVFVQLLYPGDRMLPFASVDGLGVSGWQKQDVTNELNRRMQAQTVAVKVGNSGDVYDSPPVQQIGVKRDNAARISDSHYPWYLRLIPTSILWFGPLQADGAPSYTVDSTAAKTYLNKQLGSSCNIPAKNATVQFTNDRLEIVSSKQGGTCTEADALRALTSVRPLLSTTVSVTIPVTATAPTITDDDATKLASKLRSTTTQGVRLSVAGDDKVIPQNDVLSWLTFKSDKPPLSFQIDPKKSDAYFAKNITPAIAKPAGVTKISTRDYTVTSKKVGATGKTLELAKTLGDITQVINGTKPAATAFATDLKPKVVYTRSYTKTSTGIAALIDQFDVDNPGVYGVSFRELGGEGRSAQHNGSRQFVTASTYKLFVAFSTLRKVDSGDYKWTDKNISAGRNLSQCVGSPGTELEFAL